VSFRLLVILPIGLIFVSSVLHEALAADGSIAFNEDVKASRLLCRSFVGIGNGNGNNPLAAAAVLAVLVCC